MQARQAPPDWIDAKETHRRCSLGLTTLYRLADEGKIRTVSLKEEGMSRGKRLFSYSSILKFLDSRATGGEGAQVKTSDQEGAAA